VKRLFIGLKLSAPSIEAVAGVVVKLRPLLPDVKWVPERNLHITLLFVGDVGDEKVGDVDGLLSLLSVESTIHGVLEGVGTFPSRGSATVFHVRVGEAATITRLSHRVRGACGSVPGLFVPVVRKFVPHLTVGRSRSRRGIILSAATTRALSSITRVREERFDRFVLFESILSRQGPRYVEIESYPLYVR